MARQFKPPKVDPSVAQLMTEIRVARDALERANELLVRIATGKTKAVPLEELMTGGRKPRRPRAMEGE